MKTNILKRRFKITGWKICLPDFTLLLSPVCFCGVPIHGDVELLAVLLELTTPVVCRVVILWVMGLVELDLAIEPDVEELELVATLVETELGFGESFVLCVDEDVICEVVDVTLDKVVLLIPNPAKHSKQYRLPTNIFQVKFWNQQSNFSYTCKTVSIYGLILQSMPMLMCFLTNKMDRYKKTM